MRTTRGILTFLITIILVLSCALASHADDYVLLPGVLSPDEVDFKGETVTIIRRSLPNEERVALAEDLFNVKIETLRVDNSEQMMARIMAGDSKYDIIGQPHREGFLKLASSGMLLAADDYLPDEYYESLPNADARIIDKLSYNGQRYGIAIHAGVVNDTMMLTAYNKDILEKYNQPDPYELFLNGEWTYENFEKIALACTADTDGDGLIDQFGMTNISGWGTPIRFATSNGAEIATLDDGKWVYSFNEENAVYFFNQILKWKELQIMGNDKFESGTVAFNTSAHLGGNRHAVAAGINFGLVPYPKGPHIETNQFPAFDFVITFLPVNSAYPEGLIALANFLYREEDSYEKLDQMINDWMTSSEHLDMYMLAVNNWQGEGDIFQGSGLWDDIMRYPIEALFEGSKGVAAALDEVAPQAQAFLDDLFNQ